MINNTPVIIGETSKYVIDLILMWNCTVQQCQLIKASSEALNVFVNGARTLLPLLDLLTDLLLMTATGISVGIKEFALDLSRRGGLGEERLHRNRDGTDEA